MLKGNANVNVIRHLSIETSIKLGIVTIFIMILTSE